jgi:hypothetical protein
MEGISVLKTVNDFNYQGNGRIENGEWGVAANAECRMQSAKLAAQSRDW